MLWKCGWKNMSQEFRLKILEQTRNSFNEELEQNRLMSKKHKNVCTTLNYMEQLKITL